MVVVGSMHLLWLVCIWNYI